ncbi:MAG TPA: FAD-dependent oxidoreductase [Blastocatellia bacterium]|nr:FAD-dependent oxidoreductase [Blastocatellia bacterium]
MARTPLFRKLQQACRTALQAQQTGLPLDEVIARNAAARRFSRRDFLTQALSAGVTAAALPALTKANGASRVVIVGAGLAGLTCAYRLRKRGVNATIYEASNSVGGRVQTRRGFFADGQSAERGGELIDTIHKDFLQLISELGFTVDNLLNAEVAGTEPCYYFNGHRYSFAAATQDLQSVLPKLMADYRAAKYPTLYNSYTQRGLQLDRMSIVDWINETVPGGVNSNFGRLLDVAYNIEYGAESSAQSSLNLLYLLSGTSRQELQIFGASDEAFHVRGGNDQVANRLAQLLAGQIEFGYSLTALARNADGSMRLSFANGAEVTADRVVLTLPFAILRTLEFSRAGFRPLKTTAIREQGMGTNSKMHVQFHARRWEAFGCNGDTYADTGYQATWDASRAQTGPSGLMVNYTGGLIGAAFNQRPANVKAMQFLQQIDPLLPNLGQHYNGKVTVDYWPGNPLTRGSYSFWKVGQYTQFAGVEGEPEGNCLFAGEHTSVDFQGYMNGAVETGERAAKEVIASL